MLKQLFLIGIIIENISVLGIRLQKAFKTYCLTFWQCSYIDRVNNFSLFI